MTPHNDGWHPQPFFFFFFATLVAKASNSNPFPREPHAHAHAHVHGQVLIGWHLLSKRLGATILEANQPTRIE